MKKLKQIKNLMDRDGKDSQVMLFTKNKKQNIDGIALFFSDCEKIKVFEGNANGLDDKEMSFQEFISNYDFELGKENSDIRYEIKI